MSLTEASSVLLLIQNQDWNGPVKEAYLFGASHISSSIPLPPLNLSQSSQFPDRNGLLLLIRRSVGKEFVKLREWN